MNVVAAGMHHAHLVAVPVDGGRCRGVRKTGLFDHRQAVHVGPHHHQRPISVLKHGDHAGAADVLRHLEADGAQFFGHARGGLVLHQRQLGIAVKMIPEVGQVAVVIGSDLFGHVRGEHRLQCAQQKHGKA